MSRFLCFKTLCIMSFPTLSGYRHHTLKHWETHTSRLLGCYKQNKRTQKCVSLLEDNWQIKTVFPNLQSWKVCDSYCFKKKIYHILKVKKCIPALRVICTLLKKRNFNSLVKGNWWLGLGLGLGMCPKRRPKSEWKTHSTESLKANG